MSKVTDFVDTILQRFPPFRWDDAQEQSWMDDAVEELSVFSDAVIERARRDIIRTRKKPAIPTIAELVESCIDARRWIDAEEDKKKLPGIVPQPTANPRALERHELAISLLRSPIGRQAVKEGWHGPAYSWICRTGGMPSGKEIDECKRQKREHLELYSEVSGGEFVGNGSIIPAGEIRKYGSDQRKALLKFGSDIIARWDDVAKEVLHGVVR